MSARSASDHFRGIFPDDLDGDCLPEALVVGFGLTVIEHDGTIAVLTASEHEP